MQKDTLGYCLGTPHNIKYFSVKYHIILDFVSVLTIGSQSLQPCLIPGSASRAASF